VEFHYSSAPAFGDFDYSGRDMLDNRPRYPRHFTGTSATSGRDIRDRADDTRDIRDIRRAPRKACDRF